MDKPLVSIIMAVYNAANFLNSSISSVINQTYSNWELICVNDGSVDDSLLILKDFAEREKRIKMHNQPNSGIASKVRNTALQYVNGDFIFVLDSDDKISEDCLANCVQRAIELDCDCVLPDMLMENHDGGKIRLIAGLDGDRNAVLDSRTAVVQSMEWRISGIGLWSTALIKRFGYDFSGMNGDEYSTRLFLLNSNKVAFCSGIYYYLIHSQSTTRNFSLKMMDVYPVNFKLLYLLEENYFSEEVKNKFKLSILKDIVFRYSKFLRNEKMLSYEDSLKCEKLIQHAYSQIVEMSSLKEIKRIGSISDKIILSAFYPKYIRFKLLSKTYNAVGRWMNPIINLFRK